MGAHYVEKLKRMMTQIALTPNESSSSLSMFQKSLMPILSVASSMYQVSLLVRQQLYTTGVFNQARLPLPVISVGNLTWGGNGKTPMVEFIARHFVEDGICSLILTRGYGGGDEANMLQRHLVGTHAKIGIGANRVATASSFLSRYGYVNKFSAPCRRQKDNIDHGGKIGAVILDDGMQHLRLARNLDILMINGMMPWGNGRLIPCGPLREPLTALRRVHIAVIHNANMVPDSQLEMIVSQLMKIKQSLPIFFSRLDPSHFFNLQQPSLILPLTTVQNMAVLCVSAVGFANAFVQTIKKLGASYVDRMDFTDHHSFTDMDIHLITEKVKQLERQFAAKPLVVVTEKVLVCFLLPNGKRRFYEVMYGKRFYDIFIDVSHT
ncbi:probable tetraacyldisaccharide 4'-kinase, mitochondrial isoform X2 [Nymphaea colorata]|uniref:probable tetraacyldisaccharide 4'-kinase, mitochondrial isoform X2 n=1 Tax=Nymphaea colorata TaxID=210225 RepID=UPI00129EA9B7|nr:probable tetraacyldisaccharide 4'-kinase, mitochondrial isoform X2 [Nymphaea colorata]